jgi:hypothetical protein
MSQLTDEQCMGYRTMRATFNGMLRKVYEDGIAAGAASIQDKAAEHSFDDYWSARWLDTEALRDEYQRTHVADIARQAFEAGLDLASTQQAAPKTMPCICEFPDPSKCGAPCEHQPTSTQQAEPVAFTVDDVDRIRDCALAVFHGCSQEAKDVIEWYHGSLRVEVGAKGASQQAEQTAWVWNPATEAWEQVRAPGHWEHGAIYAVGPTAPALLAEPAQAAVPHPGSPEASAMMDSVLAEYNWPTNTKNAARAGYVAAARLMGVSWGVNLDKEQAR